MKRTMIFGVFLLTLTSAIAQTTFQNNVYFNSDQYTLDVEDMGILQDLKAKLDGFNEVSFKVVGHTDQDGTDSYNMDLSQKRAEKVKQYLMSNGVKASDIEVTFLGESDLAHHSMDATSKGLNRRVSVITTGYTYDNASEMVSQLMPDKQDEFIIDVNKESNLQLSKGTEVSIPPNVFCHMDGTPLENQNVELVFKEAFEFEDMVDQGLFTQTSDQILETGGMIYIGASAEGLPLRLQDGKSIELKLPAQEQKDGMELFTAVEDENGITWEETGEQITSEKSKADTPFIEVDLSPLLEVEVDEMVLPSLDFGPMPTYPKLRRKPNLPFKGNYSEEGYVEAVKKYEAALADYEIEKESRPEKLEKWLKEANRRREILFEHKKQYVLSTVRDKVKTNMERLKKDNTRISHDRLVDVLFSFLGKTVGRVQYDEWHHVKKTFGGAVVHVRKNLGLDFPMYDKMPAHYFFQNIDNAIKEIRREVALKKYEMGYIDASVMSRYVIAASTVGWINCDRFMNYPDEMKMDLPLASLTEDDQIYLLFKSIKSLIRPNSSNGTIVFRNIPRGEDVRLVAIRMQDGEAIMAQKDFTLGKSSPGNLEFATAEIKDLKRVFDEI